MPEEHEPSAAAPRAEELAGVGVWSLDLASGVLTTNAAARTLLEWATDRAAPALDDFLSAVHPEDVGLVQEHAGRLHELELRAMTDPLTGVRNSRAFRDDLAAAVSRWPSSAAPLSLALIDIDHFKAVNDEYGHAAGDDVLVAVVERLVGATRHVGMLARVGGDEFALLLTGLDVEQAREVVGEALARLRADDIPGAGRVTASAGVAGLAVDMDESTLYKVADAQLYEAKRQGRNQVR